MKINGTTSGSVTLAAPATGSDVTLTLPGSAGTVAVVGSAAMTLITSGTLSGASVVLSSIPATYRDLRLIVLNFLPATDSAGLNIRINGDSGANRYLSEALVSSANAQAFTATSLGLGASNDNAVATGITICEFLEYANTTTWKLTISDTLMTDPTTTTSFRYRRFYGAYNQVAAISSLTLFADSGNMTSGTYSLYGIG